MQKKRFYLSILFFLIIFSSGRSQIISPYADYADTAAYSYLLGNDTLYFFAPGNDSTFLIIDTLNYNPDNILWEEFVPGVGYQPLASTAIKLFVTPAATANGYRLTVQEGGNTYIERCWVIRYSFGCTISPKDENDTLLTVAYSSDCGMYGPIEVKVESENISYYNPISFEKISYYFKYNLKWSRGIEGTKDRIANKGSNGNNYKFNIENAHYEDMWYWITVTDSLGVKQYDSVFVRSINPYAKFTVEYIALDDKKYYPDRDTNYYFFYSRAESHKDVQSAPAYYLFISTESKNAHLYNWNFGDSTTYKTTADSVLKIYNKWSKNYVVTLTAIHIVKWSGKQCATTYTLEEGVEVSEPKLQAPNAFSVNSSLYPAWRFFDVSITDFEVSIFNRYGMRVHHFKGNIRDWEGWDGRINKTDNFASTGVYYYVVKDIGAIRNFDPETKNKDLWSDNSTDGSATPDGSADKTGKSGSEETNDEYRGFFHLFNNEN